MRRRSSSVGSKPRAGQRGAVEEELHRLGVEAERVIVGHGKRVDHVDRLADEAERFPAGGHHTHRPSGLEDLLGEERSGAEDVLAVVQHQQHLGAAGAGRGRCRTAVGTAPPGCRARRRPPRPRPRVEGVSGGVAQRRADGVGGIGVGGADVGEADQPDAVGVVADAGRGGFDGEPGLAATAGADERDQASLVEQVADLGHRLHAADEAGDRLRQVVGVLADRLQRGESRSRPSAWTW